ncbi:hypothetical protein BHC43_04325 [Snodgrassella alvi]|nr:hypothetical protein BHC43_04325 [Snodgrassella alvi]
MDGVTNIAGLCRHPDTIKLIFLFYWLYRIVCSYVFLVSQKDYAQTARIFFRQLSLLQDNMAITATDLLPSNIEIKKWYVRLIFGQASIPLTYL